MSPGEAAVKVTPHDATDRLQKWLLGLMGGFILFAVGGWFHLDREAAKRHESQSVRLSVLETKMDLMLNREKRIDALEKWQREWPQTGRLQEDVRQNSRLDVLETRLKEMRKGG